MDAHHPTIREALESAADRTDELIEALKQAEAGLEQAVARIKATKPADYPVHVTTEYCALEITRAAIAKATGGAA